MEEEDITVGISESLPEISTAAANVLKEILSTERTFVNQFKDFKQVYVEALRDALRGEDRDQLCLSLQEVDSNFSFRVDDILSLNTIFLERLERIDEKAADYQGGKIEYVCVLFQELLDGLKTDEGFSKGKLDKIYGVYASGHPAAVELCSTKLEQRCKTTIKTSGFCGMCSTSKTVTKYPTFLDVWKDVTSDSDKSVSLKGQLIQGVLLTPIQRVLRYKLLLSELKKQLDKHDGDYKGAQLLDTTIANISVAAIEVDRLLKTAEKVNAMVGQDVMAAIEW